MSNGNYERDVERYLMAEADRLAYFYGRQYRNKVMEIWGKVGMRTRGIAMGAMGWGDVWHLFFANIKTIIFGPWLIGGVLIFLQWMLIGAYISPIVQNPLFFVMPGLLGGLVFLLNIEASRQPMDWLTHLISGGLIGFSTLIVMVAFITPETLLGWNWVLFWVLWLAFAVFIGVFQFYQTGGFLFIFQISVIALLFGYIALGPYSGYYRMTLDQIKPPIILAYRAVSDAVTDVWLLATDPTEYYARLQLKNVRPEKAMDYPKALEITSLDAIPPNVHLSTEDYPTSFAAFVVTENKGDAPARNINVELTCKGIRCDCNTDDMTKLTEEKKELQSGEGDVVRFSDIEPRLQEGYDGREAEFGTAKVTVNVSYDYSTSSSLSVEVASDDEITRKQLKEGDIFKPKQSVVKVTPAQVSLNVGPQPLFANKENMLVVSVLNQRDDGDVVLPEGTKINITLPGTIGTGLECPEGLEPGTSGETTTITINKEIVVKAYEFKTIYSFICKFQTSDVPVSKTDFITAALIDYTFMLKKSKTVTLSPPLGVIPIESQKEEGAGGEGPPSVTKAPALHVKIDPEKNDEGHVEVWAFHLTSDTKFDAGDGVDFALDNFDNQDNPGEECVVLAVNEEGYPVKDSSSVWYIKPGAVIKQSSNRLWDDVKNYIVDWGCTERLVDYCDFCVDSGCINHKKAGPDPSKADETVGGALYTTEPDDKCKEDACRLLKQDAKGNHYWTPRYEILCDNEGNWNVCVDEGTATAEGKTYSCSDGIWK